MPRALSFDLRVRVLAAVVQGLSRRGCRLGQQAGKDRLGGPASRRAVRRRRDAGNGLDLEPDSKVYTPREPSEGELDAGEGNEGREGVGEVLVVLGEAAVAAEP